jgi:hypothetical protein
MDAYKIVISTNDISSASCDLHDIISCLRRRKGLESLQGVKKFLESLSGSFFSDENIEVEVDSCNLESCIEQLVILVASLDEETRNESKDDEDSETTIGDCVEAVLDFLKSLRKLGEEPTIPEESMKVIRELRDLGYAVCIFNPDELRGAKPHKVEDELVSAGWEIIDTLASE